jgi:cell fate (sporulation/competence/biofilm development) regulator YlbF (YheA/YmcA/DUF963 family)
MIDVIAKTDEVINTIDKSDIVVRLKELKSIMDNDHNIQDMINAFNQCKRKYEEYFIVNNELTNAKEILYNNPIVSEYRTLYSDLNRYLLKFNKDISLLLDINNNCK